MRPFLLAFAVAVAVPVMVHASIQTQRAQIFVTIEVDVTPNPLGYLHHSQGESPAFSPVARLVEVPSSHEPRAEGLTFLPGNVLAQSASQQKAVKVEAEVSPNPNGTLLTSNNCQGSEPAAGNCSLLDTQVEAGTTVTITCAYQIEVDTTEASWTLDHGLFSDFTDGSGTFAGKYATNNTHIATPLPAFTPFIVYSDGQAWAVAGSNGGTKTYCVDLNITPPISTAQGSYVSKATYTLFY